MPSENACKDVFFCGWWFEGEGDDWFGLIRRWYLCCSFLWIWGWYWSGFESDFCENLWKIWLIWLKEN